MKLSAFTAYSITLSHPLKVQGLPGAQQDDPRHGPRGRRLRGGRDDRLPRLRRRLLHHRADARRRRREEHHVSQIKATSKPVPN